MDGTGRLKSTTFLGSLNQALRHLLESDPSVFIWGEDLLDPYGGAFKVTAGLQADYPDRVLTTPISEAAIVGLANGMALRGYRPVVEIMFGDFITLAADQIINYAAKFRAMYRGQGAHSLVIRTPMGGGRGYGPTHSQSIEKIFFGIPGLRIVAPSLFHDPGALLTRAVQETDDPVLFIEHKLLYAQEIFPEGEQLPGLDGFPTRVVRNYTNGEPDVTLIGYGGVSLWLEPLMGRLAEEEIRLVAYLPASVQPLPIDDLAAAAAETGRVVIVEEATRTHGWGAEVAAALTERLWGKLKGPVVRVGAADTIVPTARPLEDAVLPSPGTIEKAIYKILA
jgi:pyruvate/2-oxoglutarate/acetoin dehydrogenase E1 component